MARYQEAIRLRPGYAEAHNNLGVVLLQKDRIDEAIARFESALRIEPFYADAHNNLGNAWFGKGEWEKAAGQFQQALEILPGSVEPHYNLGNTWLRQGKLDRAAEEYAKALSIEPAHTAPGAIWAGCSFRPATRKMPSLSFARSSGIRPDDAGARNNLGCALEQLGKTGEAVKQFQLALEVAPDFAEARSNLVRVLQRRNPGTP